MDYLVSVITIAGINIIMALSFYLPFMTGQISLGQAGFMSIGAYASAVCTVKFGIPYVPCYVRRVFYKPGTGDTKKKKRRDKPCYTERETESDT